MKSLGLNELRKAFLDFFQGEDHLVKGSYSLVPMNDKSLLLVNAGMQPLKNYFTGAEKPPHSRMATCQKCFRTVDIDNVGLTSRHATMFEMLGNFSFGDYFKKESLEMGWRFLIDVLEMDPELLWPTIYEDDDEAFEIWRAIGVPEERIVRLGKDTNFWEIGVGPCGPCSEIHIDRGPKYGCGNPDCKPGCDCDRYLEFWNHVFSQFNREEDGSYTPLTNKNIDTGMGLERIACILQGVDSIFDIDVIKRIYDRVVAVSHPEELTDAYRREVSSKIVTDHVKAVTFLIGDGVNPSNEGRGYVLRRIFRRASRHASKLGIGSADFVGLVDTVIDSYADGYPELVEKRDFIKRVVAAEAERFDQTLQQGLHIFEQYVEQCDGGVLPGDKLFTLYDTYGFPIELTLELLSERGLKGDVASFESHMAEQKRKAREARKEEGWDTGEQEVVADASKFDGYHQLRMDSVVSYVSPSGEEVALERTPFYPEGGGQVGDRGVLRSEGFEAKVLDTVKAPGGVILHRLGEINGELRVGQNVTAEVDYEARMSAARNHSATHLLHKALRDHLGTHVAQAGSLVTPERLRFDFSHYEAIPADVLRAIEEDVNRRIYQPSPVQVEEMPLDEAIRRGAMALFGEKYGEIARVVTMGDSIELCGGTHLSNTAEVGIFKILSEGGIAAGVRRIEATTGANVYRLLQSKEETIRRLAETLKSNEHELVNKADSIMQQQKQLLREQEQLMSKLAAANSGELLASAEQHGGYRVICKKLDGIDAKGLRNLGDQLMAKLGAEASVVILASGQGERIDLLVMANEAAVNQGAHAGNLAKQIATAAGGGGGGRPNMAQASAKDASKLSGAFQDALARLTAQK
ncbi:MAG: alanine--tRNA ligase [Bacillota bacterium]|nr:alanine--tRNA ligase [Bacillota bacterium]